MHPPFFFSDHRSVHHTPHPQSHHTGLRRTGPAVLPMSLNQMDANPFIPTYLLKDVFPDDVPATRPVRLVIVPDPQHKSLRDVIGRWLIRLGQRMILQDHPG